MTIKVLVVDDEVDIEFLTRQKFRKQIRAGELACSFALNGRKALEILQQDQDIEVIVTDLNMPQMGGLKLLQAIDKIPNLVTKAIVVTAYGDSGQMRAAMNHGAIDFLTKPVDFEALESSIRMAARKVQEIKAGKLSEDNERAVEQANEARASMSRELSAPLDVILHSCKHLDDGDLDETQARLVRDASAAGEAIRSLFQNPR